MSPSYQAINYIPDPYLGITLIKESYDRETNTLRCTSSTADYGNRVPVNFGEDIVSTCTLYLTLADLAAGCTALRKKIFDLQTLTAKNIKYIGKFGNSSVDNLYDWVKVISNPESILTDPGVVLKLITLVGWQWLLY